MVPIDEDLVVGPEEHESVKPDRERPAFPARLKQHVKLLNTFPPYELFSSPRGLP